MTLAEPRGQLIIDIRTMITAGRPVITDFLPCRSEMRPNKL